jgi:glycosyltransferase involved in cell wall biosynthesis
MTRTPARWEPAKHRVAIVTAFPEETAAPRGGVEAVSVNLAGALSRLEDLELHVVTTDAQRTSRTTYRWNEVTVHRLPRLGRTVLGGAVGAGRRQMHGYLRELRVDLVHAHDTYGLMVKGLRQPRVLTIHGFIHADTLVSGGRFARLRAAVWRLFETSSWADQPHIIAISPYVRERLRGIARGVIHDIDNPVAEEMFDLPRQDAAQGTVLSAAVVSHRKNTIGLVEAVGAVREMGMDVRLRLAGAITEAGYGAQVRERVARLGLEERVDVLGRIGSDDVRRELSRASVFALVSLEENSPMGIQEAMAVGVPVVTSNRCGMPYLVRHGETGFLVDPLNTDDVAEHLATVLRSGELRRAMGERSRTVARERFHPLTVALRTREVYRRALSRPGPPPPLEDHR